MIDKSSEEYQRFIEIGLESAEGTLRIYKHADLLTRWIIKWFSKGEFNISAVEDLKFLLETDPECIPAFNIAGVIKLHCGIGVIYYAWNCIIPLSTEVGGRNIFPSKEIDVRGLAISCPCLSRRELYNGLKLIGERDARNVLSSVPECFDDLFNAYAEDNFNKFISGINDTNVGTLSCSLIPQVVISKMGGSQRISKFKMIQRIVGANSYLKDTFCELFPSHNDYWTAFKSLVPSMSDAEYMESAILLYDYFKNYTGEMTAIARYCISAGIIGRAKCKRVLDAVKICESIVDHKDVDFDSDAACTREILSIVPVISEMAVKLIRKYNVTPENTSEFNDSAVGLNLNAFLKENFEFKPGRYDKLLHGEFKIFDRLCELITNISGLKKGGQRHTYALLYLFFPSDFNQKSTRDNLAGCRLNPSFLKWKDEPADSSEAFDRLEAYFPALRNNKTTGQPSLPSRSREAIKERIEKGERWIVDFIRLAWSDKAIEKCDFKKIVGR